MHTVSDTPENPAFFEHQLAFTARVRDPENQPLPTGVEARRMAVYEELIYNNIDDFLSSAFPVLRKISSDNYWRNLVRDFLIRHRAHTPLFPELPREFLTYLEHTRTHTDDDHPFLHELAHYEWAELAVSISETTIEETQINPVGSLLEGVPVLTPSASLCSYRYPVHRIGPNYLPQAPADEPIHLLVYRDRAYQVRFIELNTVTAQLLHALQQNNTQSGRTLLQTVALELRHPNLDTVIDGGLQLLETLRSKNIILGVR